MQTLRRSGHQKLREQGQNRAESMAIECILCFAVMKKLKKRRITRRSGLWIGSGAGSCTKKVKDGSHRFDEPAQGLSLTILTPGSIDADRL